MVTTHKKLHLQKFSTVYLSYIFIAIIVLIVHCAKHQKAMPTSIIIKELGFSMKVPEGWKIGEPALQKDKKWLITKDGSHCFPSEKSSYPFGRVWSFPVGNFSSLDEFVHTIPTLHGKTLQELPIKVCGFDGIEIISSGIGENRIPVKEIYQYFTKDSNFIVVSFLTLDDSFTQQEASFRASLNTIEVK
ncbi:MAG: hypothetical protein ABIK61_07560 [candidate division WOR-3 bacterium]